jgi:hypothetical protein
MNPIGKKKKFYQFQLGNSFGIFLDIIESLNDFLDVEKIVFVYRFHHRSIYGDTKNKPVRLYQKSDWRRTTLYRSGKHRAPLSIRIINYTGIKQYLSINIR